MGLLHDDFWRHSLRECDLIICEALARQKSELLTKRILNQELAVLVSYAFSDPAKMPDFTKEVIDKQISEKESAIRLRSLFVGWSAKSKG
ncbi:MAG: hypothetical protein V7695_24570 [Sulfitobacter sp.]